MAHVIAIYNNKGGVGKTTTSVNLAYALASKNKRTLLIDFDPQANGSKAWGIKAKGEIGTIYNLLTTSSAERLPVSECIHKTSLDTLHVIPASNSLSAINMLFVAIPKREDQLKNLIKKLEASYDYILIDNQPSNSILTMNALSAATFLLIPIEPSLLAIDSFYSFYQDTIVNLGVLNQDLLQENKIKVLITKYDRSKGLGPKETIEVIKKIVPPGYLLDTVIHMTQSLSEAWINDGSIFEYDQFKKRKSRGGIEYDQLGDEIIALLDNATISQPEPALNS